MKKHILSSILSILLFSFNTHAMEMGPPTPAYITHPEKYTDFKLTRSYGKFRSNDLLDSWYHIDSYVHRLVVPKLVLTFQHRLLNAQWQDYEKDVKSWQAIPLETSQQKTFQYSHHRYAIVPDVTDYVMWDGDRGRYWLDTVEGKSEVVRLLSDISPLHDHLFCPKKQYEEDNMTSFYLANLNSDKYTTLFFPRRVTYHIMSSDAQWLAFACSNSAISFFNIQTRKFAEGHMLDNNLTALCAAHRSPLFVACIEKTILFIVPGEKENAEYEIPITPTSIRFSPHDTYLFMHDGYRVLLWDIKNEQWREIVFDQDDGIRKIFFLSDSAAVVALENGKLILWPDLSRVLADDIVPHLDAGPWRHSTKIDIDDQAPVMLWSDTSKLLFSLDPAAHTDDRMCTFIVRKSTNGRFLTYYNFMPDNPIAMGLTQDERSVIFMHKDGNACQLDLYKKGDNQDIDFIIKEANFYQLCCLQHAWKGIKRQQLDGGCSDRNAKLFVDTVKGLIDSYRDRSHL